MTKIPPAKDPARNVWLQLGLPDAEEHYLKAELVFRLDKSRLAESDVARLRGLALPLLTMLADVVGIFGGMLITMREVGVTSKFFFTQVKDTLWVVDLVHGLGKSVFFGYFIGIIGCFVGLQTQGGTEGVGVSTTRAVVITAITLLVSNYILSTIFVAVYG